MSESAVPLPGLDLFQGDEHRPFTWSGGAPAALLVHGFPGSPAELRPLGRALLEAGWTVHAPLLPGFGPAIATLGQRRAEDWVAAVRSALADLAADHAPTLLVGFSMGGALALQAAADVAPDGLVLVAPFRQLGGDTQQLIWPLLRRVFPSFKPFARADFEDPDVRQSVSEFLPDANLDDPAVQRAVRELAVPTSVVEQLRRVGRGGWQAAPRVTARTLVVQGTLDPVVQPRHTRALVGHIATPPRYLEVVAGHDLLRPESPGWPEMVTAVLGFAREVASG